MQQCTPSKPTLTFIMFITLYTDFKNVEQLQPWTPHLIKDE